MLFTKREQQKPLNKVAASAGIDCMIVGATARDILLTHVFSIPPRSATCDIDLAMAVENRDQFEQLKSRLSARKGFDACERMKHVRA